LKYRTSSSVTHPIIRSRGDVLQRLLSVQGPLIQNFRVSFTHSSDSGQKGSFVLLLSPHVDPAMPKQTFYSGATRNLFLEGVPYLTGGCLRYLSASCHRLRVLLVELLCQGSRMTTPRKADKADRSMPRPNSLLRHILIFVNGKSIREDAKEQDRKRFGVPVVDAPSPRLTNMFKTDNTKQIPAEKTATYRTHRSQLAHKMRTARLC